MPENLFQEDNSLKAIELSVEVRHGHTKNINVVRYSASGQMLATGSDDYKVIIWQEKLRPKVFGAKEMILSWVEAKILLWVH